MLASQTIQVLLQPPITIRLIMSLTKSPTTGQNSNPEIKYTLTQTTTIQALILFDMMHLFTTTQILMFSLESITTTGL